MADSRIARGSCQPPVFSSRGRASAGELKTENPLLAGGFVDMVQSGGRRRDACGDTLATRRSVRTSRELEMSDRRAFRCVSLLVVAAVLATGPACEWLENLAGPGPAGAGTPGYGVILRLVNQSGVPVQVEVGYLFGQTRTRDTMRLLAAEGIETEQIVLWTRAEVITATARVSAGPPSGAARVRIGDVIAEQEYRYDVDYHAGDTIEFVIPELGPGPDPLADCNGNGVFDTLDLAAGTSLDCNGNEIPDECDTANGTSADYDGDAVPDECEQEACCFADGSCQEKIAKECADSGGDPRGAGTVCATTNCPGELTEACCFDGGSCQNLSAAACAAQGGTPQGTGTTCVTVYCQPPDPCLPPYGSPCAPGCPDYCNASACGGPDCNGNGIADRCENLARLYVDARAEGANDGTSWHDAFVSLDAALQRAWCAGGLVQEIWVATGVYQPEILLVETDPRSATFALPPLVNLYGHFAGGEENLADRALSNPAHETVLSGDIGDREYAGDNCYHVLMPRVSSFLGRIDGFTIAYGNADGRGAQTPASGFGGGMYCLDSAPIVANCTFRDNAAAIGGGGLCVDGLHPSSLPAWVTNCRFIDNEVAGGACPLGGGGMIVAAELGLVPAAAAVTNCVFVGNSSAGYGGGLLGWHSALGVGLANCSFSLNQAGMSVGAGAAVYNDAYVLNSIFWGNGPSPTESAQIDLDALGAVTVAYNCIQGWTGTLPGAGVGNIGDDPNDDPLFVAPESGDLRLGLESPCIDVGFDTAVPPDVADLDHDGDTSEQTPVDVDGLPRFMPTSAPAVDMGAYEEQEG
jgi:hypothetical protein